MQYEIMVKRVFKKYLDSQGYCFSDTNLNELVDVYMDCQEWDEDTPLTGMTEYEMLDWVKHTSEVNRIDSENDKRLSIRKMILFYLKVSNVLRGNKTFFDIESAG